MGPREPVVDDRPPVLRSIQKVRTPHGTRVARRITCTVCGAGDTIDFAPRDPSEVLCRKCAFAKRGVLDPDDAAARTLQLTCLQCKRAFERAVDPADPHDSRPPLCNDCKHGVETQQQDRAKGATRVSAKVVRSRPRPKPGA